MADEQETTLIHLVKEKNDSAALVQLADMHSGMYFEVANRYAHCYPDLIKIDDIKDNKLYNIYQFVKAYKDDKDKTLCSYIADRTDYMCKDILKKERRNPINCVVDEKLLSERDYAADKEQARTECHIDIQDIFKVIESKGIATDDRFLKILSCRHLNSNTMSWRQIGKTMKMSHERVRSIYNIEMKKIKDYLIQ